jgi:hypothetical protein
VNTSGEDMMDSLSALSKESEIDEELQEWQSLRPRKMKKKLSKQVVVATRTSKRLLKDGIPIAEKAAARAIAKNTILGNSSSNPFTVLGNTPTNVLKNVPNDLNIVVNDARERIGVFRAEEHARAALTEANYKVFLDKQKDRDKPCEEDYEDALNMGIIDNSICIDNSIQSKMTMEVSNRASNDDVVEISKGGNSIDKNPCQNKQ